MRIDDFLIEAPRPGLEDSAAALGCHLMWWSDNNRVDAPFRKLHVLPVPTRVGDAVDWARVFQSGCTTLFVEPRDGNHPGSDLSYCCDLVLRALSLVHRDLGWRSALLEAYVKEVAEAVFPLVAPFPGVSMRDRATGSTFTAERWSAPGRHAVVLVRTGPDGTEQRVPLDERHGGGLYEVEFVVKRLRVVDGNCEAREKSGALLARVPIAFAGTLGPVRPPSGCW